MKRYVFISLFFFFWTVSWAQNPDKHSGDSVEPVTLKNLSPLLNSLSAAKGKWVPVDTVPLKFRTFHTQGLMKVGDSFFMTAVEVLRKTKPYGALINGYDRDEGAGRGHVFKFDKQGNLIAHVLIGEGAVYHPGGLDFDGTHLWIPVCEYRPFGKSVIYTLDPTTMDIQRKWEFDDAIGGLAYDRDRHRVIGANWGSAHLFVWQMDPAVKMPVGVVQKWKNYHYNLAVQDMHYIDGYIFCSGYSTYGNHPQVERFAAGGISVLRPDNFLSVMHLPVDQFTEGGLPMTANPFYVEYISNKSLFYFAPEDDDSKVYVYELR